MNSKEIFEGLYKKRKSENHFFGRKLVVVSTKGFDIYKKHFKRSSNFFNKKENYRTKELFKHIHAVKEGNKVQFHFDYGNTSFLFVGWLTHFFFDVLPYFTWHLIKLKRPYTFG